MPASNFLATAKIGHIMGKSTYTAPTTYYIALCKTVPIASNTGSTISEVTYTNYVRLAKVSGDFTAVTANAVSNVAALLWATAGATGDTALGFAVCDAVSGGNVLYFDALSQTLVISAGGVPTIAAGQLVLGES